VDQGCVFHWVRREPELGRGRAYPDSRRGDDEFVSVSDEDLTAPVVDYSRFYPTGEGEALLGEVTYAQLKSGSIEVKGKQVPTGCFQVIPRQGKSPSFSNL